MRCKELRRAGLLARVESGELKLVDAAVLMGMSYRQSKRSAKRYREGGAQGLKHGSAGRESNRRKSKKFREQVLRMVSKKYSGEEGERFGPTFGGEPVSGEGISAGTQSAVSKNPGAARGLSSSGRAGSGVGGRFSSGNRTNPGQRLGGAAHTRYFEVKSQSRQYAPAKGKVTVCEWEDGRLQIRYRGWG